MNRISNKGCDAVLCAVEVKLTFCLEWDGPKFVNSVFSEKTTEADTEFAGAGELSIDPIFLARGSVLSREITEFVHPWYPMQGT